MAFYTTTRIGGNGGFEFLLRGGSDGRVVKKLEVWAMENGVKAIRVWLTLDSYSTFGQPSKPAGQGDLRHASFSFQDDERITTLSLWGNGAGTRFGWIRFNTNKGRTFDHGMYKWGKKDEYVQSVASGIFVGVSGRANLDVDRLGLVFLTPISRMRIINLSYALPINGTVSQQTLDTFSYTNKNDEDARWVFNDNKDVTNTFKWELINKSGLSFYHNVDDGLKDVQVPEVKAEAASGKVTYTWELSGNDTYSSTSLSNTKNLEWYASGSLKPTNSISVSAVTGRGSISTSFKAFMQVDLTSNTKISYPIEGNYTGTSHSNAVVI
eukprot:c5243_g1_i1 orf=63-1034(+)